MKPVVDRLKQDYQGKVEIRTVNVEKDPDGASLMKQFKAQYVPTFVFINADGSTAAIKVGEQSANQMKQQLDALR